MVSTSNNEVRAIGCASLLCLFSPSKIVGIQRSTAMKARQGRCTFPRILASLASASASRLLPMYGRKSASKRWSCSRSTGKTVHQPPRSPSLPVMPSRLTIATPAAASMSTPVNIRTVGMDVNSSRHLHGIHLPDLPFWDHGRWQHAPTRHNGIHVTTRTGSIMESL